MVDLRSGLQHELRLFFIALQFLTRVPVPAWVGWRADWMNQSARHFALVGACVGAFGGAVFWAAAHLWPATLAVLLSMVATVWITGAFHEDGLADTCDGLGGAVSRQRALDIMKDSRLGTYGTLGLLAVLALKAAALAGLAARDLAATLVLPLQVAVLSGVAASLVVYLYRTAHPALRIMGFASPPAPAFSAVPVLPPTRRPSALAFRPVPSTTTIRSIARILSLVPWLKTREPLGALPGSIFINVDGRQMPPLTRAA